MHSRVENAERVAEMFRRSSELIERRDDEEGRRVIEEYWHEDCEFVPLIAGVEGRSTYRGREGVIRFFADLTSAFDFRYRDVSFEQVGDAVLVLATMDLHGRGSEIEVERELALVYEFDGDLIRRGQAYDSHHEASRAAKELAGA